MKTTPTNQMGHKNGLHPNCPRVAEPSRLTTRSYNLHRKPCLEGCSLTKRHAGPRSLGTRLGLEFSEPPYAALTEIFFSWRCASGFLGSTRVRTPLVNVASILSALTVSGTWNDRSKEP
jgi:hypothetical protein